MIIPGQHRFASSTYLKINRQVNGEDLSVDITKICVISV